jgi:hypothetical protein
MRQHLMIKTCSLALASSLLCSCGLAVPQVGEIWDDESGNTALILERKIKEKIFCELQTAVAAVNSGPPAATYEDPSNPNHIIKVKSVPDSWGATLTLSLTVDEMSGVNPGISFNTPMIPATTYFPHGITVPGSQSYNLGIGGSLSSEAKRIDKFTFFYTVKELEKDHPICREINPLEQRAPLDYQGSSLLLESDLGFYKWLKNAGDVRTTMVSDNTQQQVLSYEVSFEIISSGNVTPTWKLVRVTTPNGGLPLFNTKRDRTHDVTLTIGPVTTPAGGGKPQPDLQSANSHLASEIGSAVGEAVKRALVVQ